MEDLQNWSKNYFLNNQEVCMQKLNVLSVSERALLRQNLQHKENNRLVLLSGMIFDSKEPEFYCEKYEVKSKDGSVRVELGKFSDRLNILEHETVEDPSQHLSERQTVLIKTPGSTNEWTYDVELLAAGDQVISNKRKLEESTDDLNQSFTVKVYDNVDRPINSLVEVIGFLAITSKEAGSSSMDADIDDMEEKLPEFVIHAVAIKDRPHNNPLLLLDHFKQEEIYSHDEIRSDLLKLLKTFMFDDEIAAQFLLCHLISNVYARVSGEVLGKFSLNFICQAIPKDVLCEHVKKFYNFIELIVPDSVYVPLTIENFNMLDFVPKKDYKTNCLKTGLLQLPQHSHLVLDETKLESGKLEEAGCKAVADLTELIQQQQVQYDFQFYKIPFLTNIPVLILSEGKSLLPSDFAVPVKVSDVDAVRLINENIAAGIHFLKPKLNAVRKYLTECRIREFAIGEAETKFIEEDFVKMRETSNLQVEDLHSLLVLSRLIGVSRGLNLLDIEAWSSAKSLEIERVSRIGKQVANES